MSIGLTGLLFALSKSSSGFVIQLVQKLIWFINQVFYAVCAKAYQVYYSFCAELARFIIHFVQKLIRVYYSTWPKNLCRFIIHLFQVLVCFIIQVYYAVFFPKTCQVYYSFCAKSHQGSLFTWSFVLLFRFILQFIQKLNRFIIRFMLYCNCIEPINWNWLFCFIVPGFLGV